MKIIKLNIQDIKPYERNPRKNNDAVKYVVESIRQCEYVSPIIIDENNVILAGHTRYKALKELKYTEIECVVKSGLTEEQKKKYRILDNKTAEKAEWDFDLLNLELSDIDFGEFDFGFDLSVEPNAEPQEDNFELEQNIPDEPISKLGDIWQLGRHRLMCGSATEKSDVKQLMNGTLADLVVTDPPYNVNYEGAAKDKLKILNDKMPDAEFRTFLTDAFGCIAENLRCGGCFYIFHADSEGYNFRGAIHDAGLKVRQCLIWVKNTMVIGRQDYQWQHEPVLYGWKDGASHFWASDRKQKTILNFDRPTRNKEHPTMKPINILAYLIGNNTKADDVVLDLFGGSGSTLIACEQLRRTCCMMELDPKYADVITKRYEQFTGSRAIKINQVNSRGEVSGK